MYQPEVDSYVWFSAGPQDIKPARVTAVVDADDGVIDLMVVMNVTAHTQNDWFDDPMGFEGHWGPPYIALDPHGGEVEEVAYEGVENDPNGGDDTWQEP